ncbi:MAG: apolipoprotein N-acyltransferase [Deltaproteobacteria bacterium]|nr:apolipoprotein N-acyltransferase [Deltaproteobacteria bacterium]
MKTLVGIVGSAALIVGISLLPSFQWLALMVLVPALLVLDRRPVRAWIGWSVVLFFLVAIGAYYWVAHVAFHFGGLPRWLAVLLIPMFALFNIWQGSVGFALFRWLRDLIRVPHALLFALCMSVAWHLIPALFFWDFTLLVRYWWPLVQGVDLFGTFGLDCFLFATNYAVYEVVRTRRIVRSARVCAGILLALLAYGMARSYDVATDLARAPRVRVALIQPNLNSAQKADRQFSDDAIRRLSQLSGVASGQSPALIVWPESTLPIDFHHDRGLQEYLRRRVKEWRSALFFGNSDYASTEAPDWQIYNAATLLRPDTTDVQHYRKHVLLAFGEYIPFESVIPSLRKWSPSRVGHFGRGPGARVFEGPTFRFAPVICYESIRGSYMRASAAENVDFIVEISNDGWYGRTTALRYHKDLTVLRALENRITVARDTNTGMTMFVDPLGNEQKTLPLETAGIAQYDIAKHRPFSLYRHGGYHLKLAAILFLGVCIVHGMRQRRQQPAPQTSGNT